MIRLTVLSLTLVHYPALKFLTVCGFTTRLSGLRVFLSCRTFIFNVSFFSRMDGGDLMFYQVIDTYNILVKWPFAKIQISSW